MSVDRKFFFVVICTPACYDASKFFDDYWTIDNDEVWQRQPIRAVATLGCRRDVSTDFIDYSTSYDDYDNDDDFIIFIFVF